MIEDESKKSSYPGGIKLNSDREVTLLVGSFVVGLIVFCSLAVWLALGT